MIQEDTVRIYWKKLPEKVPFYEDGKDLAHVLRLRKDFILSDIEYKIVIMEQKKWVTISQSRGWES
jgi:hypothetical protein